LKKVKTWMKILDDVFDFKDKINTSLGRETSSEWNKRMLKEYWEQLMSLNVPGLFEILNEIEKPGIQDYTTISCWHSRNDK